MKTLLGDCLEKLKELPDNSVDSVVTDPPYGLAFMGKRWDYDVPSTEIWREVLRVLKPGGHLLSFGGTRTYHRMVVNIEDAGFEIRDQIQWLYGSGFPKSLDISKAIDKAAGAEREVTGKKSTYRKPQSPNGWDCTKRAEFESAPSTDLAKQWQGWGTALKPANEPIVLARKPLIGTVAKNVEVYGTGGLNIDESRVSADGYSSGGQNKSIAFGMNGLTDKQPRCDGSQGRWPANVLFDESAAAMLDEQSGVSKSPSKRKVFSSANAVYGDFKNDLKYADDGFGDSGGASRFFYVAKASKRERNAGLENITNGHPTIKPQKLMQYLIKLVTPPKGTVLDPFMGSGSTGVAAVSLGFDFIGIEREQEYLEIAKRRIDFHSVFPIDDSADDDEKNQLEMFNDPA